MMIYSLLQFMLMLCYLSQQETKTEVIQVPCWMWTTNLSRKQWQERRKSMETMLKLFRFLRCMNCKRYWSITEFLLNFALFSSLLLKYRLCFFIWIWKKLFSAIKGRFVEYFGSNRMIFLFPKKELAFVSAKETSSLHVYVGEPVNHYDMHPLKRW